MRRGGREPSRRRGQQQDLTPESVSHLIFSGVDPKWQVCYVTRISPFWTSPEPQIHIAEQNPRAERDDVCGVVTKLGAGPAGS
jgi:hypothetical protein